VENIAGRTVDRGGFQGLEFLFQGDEAHGEPLKRFGQQKNRGDDDNEQPKKQFYRRSGLDTTLV